MALDLPALPKGASIVPGLTDNSARLTPPLGGPTQTIARMGNRFYLKVTLPTLDADCADAWLAVQMRHKTELQTLRLAWPQKAVSGLPAGAQVDGAGQAGAVLAVKGLAAGQEVAARRPFNFISGGRSYLHMTTTQTVADGAGKAFVTLAPMLRVSPANSLALNFITPVIEGELDLGPVEWTVERLRFVGVSFTLTEIQ